MRTRKILYIDVLHIKVIIGKIYYFVKKYRYFLAMLIFPFILIA